MSFAKEIAEVGILPASVSFVLCVILRRFLSPDTAERYSSPMAFAAGYCTAYALFAEWADLAPKRHWHWMFYLVPFAAVIGPVLAASGLFDPKRLALRLIAALACAWMLTPHWANLEPVWPVWLGLLTGYLFLFSTLLEPLANRLPSPMLLALVALTSAASAALITGAISITYGRPAGIAAAALAGCALAACLARGARTARGISLVYSVTVGGWAFVACIDPPQPLFALMLAPAAPLALWACAYGPLARRRGWGAIVIQSALVFAVLALSTALLWAKLTPHNADAW